MTKCLSILLIDFCYIHYASLLLLSNVDKNNLQFNDSIQQNLVQMFCAGIVAFIVLIILELEIINQMKQFIFKLIKRRYPIDTNDTDALDVDESVLDENDRINCMSARELKSNVMVMKKLSKF